MRTRFLWILAAMMFYGCHDSIEVALFDESKSEVCTTRSIDNSCDCYYWYGGVKYPLTRDDEKSFVVMESSKLESLIYSADTPINIKKLKNYSNSGVDLSKSARDNAELVTFTIDKTSQININHADIIYESPFYKASDGTEVCITNLLSVRLKKKLG